MATLDDLLTTQKNGVVAINNLNQTYAYLGGKTTSATITASTLIFVGPGRLVNYSITVQGSTSGIIYNASSTGSIAASNALAATTSSQAIGVTPVGVHFSNGLVVVPGTGQSINVTYSPDL